MRLLFVVQPYNTCMELQALALKLITERIPGTRKGTLDAAWIHSRRVSERLARHGYGLEVILAGLLHDIVEDGNTSLTELAKLGFSSRTVQLVDLSSHDDAIFEKDARWAQMVLRLEQAQDSEAWAIKVCDLIDNLHGSVSLRTERRAAFFEMKAPTYLSLSRVPLQMNALWLELLEAFCEPGLQRYRSLYGSV
jgi:(p)ppGpp synthase/HD superfamily hydrolase